MEFRPHNYQRYAIEKIIATPYVGLFLEMGLGKTVTTLTAIQRLIDNLEIAKVLVIAPLRVAQSVWVQEIEKWEHLKGLRAVRVLGSEKQRVKALNADADIYVVNRENVQWLVAHYSGRRIPFDMVVLDELSSFKNHKSARWKAMRNIRPRLSRVVGLTGTPAPNGLIDLWGQVYLLDQGNALGKYITHYRANYFRPGRTNGQVVFDYKLQDNGEQRIYDAISDFCVSMKSEDYLQLPACTFHDIKITLSDKLRASYEQFVKEQVLALPEEEDGSISAVNAAALSNKLLQYASGAVYDADKNVKHIHDYKLDALVELVEEANGKPVLLFYQFKHEIPRIQQALRGYGVEVMNDDSCIDRWNNGEIPVLLAHPASTAYGLNMQRGGNIIIWYGLNWALELYQQANARLNRQGQTKPVHVYHLLVEGTMDVEVAKALNGKVATQDGLMNAIKAVVGKYR